MMRVSLANIRVRRGVRPVPSLAQDRLTVNQTWRVGKRIVKTTQADVLASACVEENEIRALGQLLIAVCRLRLNSGATSSSRISFTTSLMMNALQSLMTYGPLLTGCHA